MNKLCSALLLLLAFSPLLLRAQTDITQKGEDNTGFPEIKIRFNIHDPEAKEKTSFKLIEEGKEIDFSLKNSAPPPKALNQNKTILILLEDMAEDTHPNQKRFFQDLLTNTIDAFVNQGDMVNVAIFNRSTDGKSSIQSHLLSTYTDDAQLLKDKIGEYKSESNLWYKQKSTDLYLAIYEGLSELIAIQEEKEKILLVLSAGFNNPQSTDTDPGRSVNLARDHKIPIYSAQYYYQGWEHHKLTTIVAQTQGREVVTSHTNRATEQVWAQDSLRMFMTEAIRRNYGQDYEITFTTAAKRDGQSKGVGLKFNNKLKELAFNTPEPTVVDIINNNIAIFGGIAGGIALLVVLLFVFKAKKEKQQQAAELARQSEMDNMKADNEKRDAELKRIEEEEAKKRQEMEAQIAEARRLAQQQQQQIDMERQAKLATEQREREVAEEKRLINEMNIKGLPRIVCNQQGSNFSYTMAKPKITIGRNNTTDIALVNNMVSREHATISYRNGAYYITDLNSSNGTTVNGTRIKEYQLKNSDTITIGGYQLLFFMGR